MCKNASVRFHVPPGPGTAGEMGWCSFDLHEWNSTNKKHIVILGSYVQHSRRDLFSGFRICKTICFNLVCLHLGNNLVDVLYYIWYTLASNGKSRFADVPNVYPKIGQARFWLANEKSMHMTPDVTCNGMLLDLHAATIAKSGEQVKDLILIRLETGQH